jgi:hypothetical protein
MKAPKLSNGLRYGVNSAGEKICLGAQMGRRNTLPANPAAPLKLRLVRLRLVDGDYDAGGAYWGFTAGTAIYWAYGDSAEVFVRAGSRADAKGQVLQKIPSARFYR